LQSIRSIDSRAETIAELVQGKDLESLKGDSFADRIAALTSADCLI